jgi:hypothetical protein
VDEFERRLDRVHTAQDLATIEAVIADLVSTPHEPTGTSSVALVPMSDVEAERRQLAIFGGFRRSGAWRMPRKLKVTTVMGGGELDFREAQLGPGVSEVEVFAMMGGLHVVVPPGLAVDVEGSGIMGGFDSVARSPAQLDPNAPMLRIRGTCVMGGVHVETRLPGEPERQARRRDRRERKALRAAERHALPAKRSDGD